MMHRLMVVGLAAVMAAVVWAQGTSPSTIAPPVAPNPNPVPTLPPLPAPALTPVAHPFILWTKDEAAALRARAERDDWARQALEAMRRVKPDEPGAVFANLFRAGVMGEADAIATEKAALLGFIGNTVESTRNRRPYTDHYLMALRYDVLCDQLSDAQRRDIEAEFGKTIDFDANAESVMPPVANYDPTIWSPSMGWPHRLGVMLLAVALEDEARIKRLYEVRGGWKWFFETYVRDGRFLNESPERLQPLLGEMLLTGAGLQRLGLDAMGGGLTGRNGASLRRVTASFIDCGWPRVEMGTARPHYPLLTVGDRRAPLDGPLAYALQQPLVAGYAPNGAGGTPRFTAALVTGRDHRGAAVEKLGLPLIFELAHRQWPDAGFDYFLAAMREPTSDRYYPSLLFSLEPIDRRTARAPLAPSWTARERGLALLRAEESPEYWESPAPAVAMRLGAAQVGGTPDSLGLLGFYAFGRPLYLNRQCAVGDAGLDPAWSASAKSAAVVLVNGQEPRATPTVTTRESFTPLVKVLVASGTGVNASGFGQGLDQTRGLLLTREYLLDMTRLQGSWDATYLWTVHGLGMPSVDKPELWKPAPELADLYAPLADTKAFEATEKSADPLVGPKALPWSVRLVQGCPVDAKTTVMGAAWYDRRIGVAVRMLPEPGTTVFTAKTPPIRGRDGKEIADEFGGTTLIAKRKTGATAFVALHEPFQGEPRIAAFTKFGEFAVQPNPYTRELQAIGTTVTGRADSPVNDRVFLQFKTDKPVSIAEQAPPAGAVPEHITFADYAYIRIGKATVDAVGDIRALRVRVAGTPKLMLNGQPAEATVVNGVLEYTGK